MMQTRRGDIHSQTAMFINNMTFVDIWVEVHDICNSFGAKFMAKFITFSFFKQIIHTTCHSESLKNFGHYHYELNPLSTCFFETIEKQ